MKTIDITIDFETCALCPTAAVMSVAAVAWKRDAVDSPFYSDDVVAEDILDKVNPTFLEHIDLRSMFVDGFTFDQNTAEWWATRSAEAKKALLNSDDDVVLHPIALVVMKLFKWIAAFKDYQKADSVNLWSQGSDFDIAILRNICHKYGIEIPVNYKNFRDHRTFFMEGARIICDIAGTEFVSDKARTLVEDYKDVSNGAEHDPVFDCKRSIYSTWQMMRHLHCLTNGKVDNK